MQNDQRPEEVSAETTSAFRADFRDELREATAADTERAAAVEGLPSGAGMLVVKRGPNAGSRFLLPSSIWRATNSASSTSAASTAPMSTANPWTRRCWPTVTRSRSESSGWCSYAVDLVPVDLYLC
jgi:hypothetical protein